MHVRIYVTTRSQTGWLNSLDGLTSGNPDMAVIDARIARFKVLSDALSAAKEASRRFDARADIFLCDNAETRWQHCFFQRGVRYDTVTGYTR